MNNKRSLFFLKPFFTLLFSVFLSVYAIASSIMIPMDLSQANHLKAYGLAYWAISGNVEVNWLLNYRGGSFSMDYAQSLESECKIRGISYEVVPDVQMAQIVRQITDPETNTDIVKLEKAPRIAVYSPKDKLPWDDAVTLVLTYAEIPYTLVYDDDVVRGELPKYDWLHLHHEDFTGQYGRFWSAYRNASWYQKDVATQEETAKRLGFNKVSELKLAVATKIRDFTAGGGYLFAMCSATDSYDIALSAEGIDICENMFDGDGADQNAQKKLDFSKTFAFRDYQLDVNPYNYEFSNIDVTQGRKLTRTDDYFSLFEFSAKYDVVPTMLTQCHQKLITGFMGQTTAFNKNMIKPTVTILGETSSNNEARYIHGEFGYGTFTFYGGHDPEDYQHQVGDPTTDLNLHPQSPGYRLILNNILFPAAKKKKQKT